MDVLSRPVHVYVVTEQNLGPVAKLSIAEMKKDLQTLTFQLDDLKTEDLELK
jgi:hypothetical protein